MFMQTLILPANILVIPRTPKTMETAA